MKKTGILMIMMLMQVIVEGQTFAPPGSNWHYNLIHDVTALGSPGRYHYSREAGDTMISGKSCTRVEEFNICPATDDTIQGKSHFYYTEGLKVYQYEADQFYLLYDYTLQAGDSLFLHQNLDPLQVSWVDTLLIDSVKLENFGGHELRMWYVHYPKDSIWEYYSIAHYAERFGSIRWMEPLPMLWIVPYGPLRCYEDQEISIHVSTENPPVACDYAYLGMKELNVNQLNLYPNPLQNELTIEVDAASLPLKLNLLDVSGKAIFEFTQSKSKQIFSLSTLEAGVYFVHLGEQRLKLVKE